MAGRRPKTKHRRGGGTFAAGAHDHRQCVTDALDAAGRLCRDRGERLTPLRQRVLELVWDSHRPIGAYEILDLLRRERGRVAPPTVYRALEFLLDQGLVHRVESRNAYIGCDRPEHRHRAHFMLCTGCGLAAEVDDDALTGAIAALARRAAFAVEQETVELTGLCPVCRDDAGGAAAGRRA